MGKQLELINKMNRILEIQHRLIYGASLREENQELFNQFVEDELPLLKEELKELSVK